MADLHDRYCCSRISNLKLSQGAKGEFSGMLNVYNILDLNGEVVDSGCFQDDLQQYGAERVMLWQHDTMQPTGTLSVKEISTGLPFEAKTLIDDDYPLGKASFACVKAGVIKAMSIGFTPDRDGIKFGPVAGGDANQSVCHITKGRLFEGSEVTFPANEQSLIDRVNAYRGVVPAYGKGILPQDLLAAQRHKAAKCQLCQKKDEHIQNAIDILDKILAYGSGNEEDSSEDSGTKALMGVSDQEYKGLRELADSLDGVKA